MGKKCLDCGGFNHFRKVCEKRKTRASFATMEGDTSCSDTEYTEEEFDHTDADDEPHTDKEYYHFAARAGDFCVDQCQRPST